jgi:hypothetical protein
MVDVIIPQSAYDKADEIAGRYPSDREAAAHIAAEVIAEVAPLILAAELDRLIEDEAVNVNENGYLWRGIDVEDLRRRATELRGEAQ